MGLKHRLSGGECISGFEQAREDRVLDALTCALDQRNFAACYLFGYAVEMMLKCAYFRFAGVEPYADIGPHRAQARRQQARLRQTEHDLRAWAEALVEERNNRGRALDPGLAGAFLHHVLTIADHWSEVLRYHPSIPADSEAAEMCNQIDELQKLYPLLWN
ncbi:MAG: hypothetical protein BroJett003_03630 [Planctomycetota bacterium]|nr:MAG: hypothetical protein BroJett003_03630 [Planctomycetota bacterium]